MSSFSAIEIQRIWEKGEPDPAYDPDVVRKDICGAWLIREDYGKTDSFFGWQVDHVCPVSLLQSKGVPQSEIDQLENLQPMNSANNESKSDNYPSFSYAMTSRENSNVKTTGTCEVPKELQARLKEIYPFL